MIQISSLAGKIQRPRETNHMMISLGANHLEAAAPLFRAEEPRVGTADFGAEEGFRVEARRLFLMTLNALRRRGNSRNSLNTVGRINQASGSARPQSVSNLA